MQSPSVFWRAVQGHEHAGEDSKTIISSFLKDSNPLDKNIKYNLRMRKWYFRRARKERSGKSSVNNPLIFLKSSN